MKKIRIWTYQTANLILLNEEGIDGMTHREAFSFLSGLRLSGEIFGFWTSHVDLVDKKFAVDGRGKALLAIAGSLQATS